MIESYTDKAAIDRAAVEASRFFSFDDESAMLADAAERDARRAEANRLVKAAKSEPSRFPGLTGAFFNRPRPRRKPVPVELDQEAPNVAPDLTQPGTWAVVERRDWCGEYRLRMETRPGAGAETPDNAGDRITAMLTERGARKISEACYYMACQRGGFTTFATLTLTPEARAQLVQRVLVPMFPVNDAGFPQIPKEPARAKQGRLSVQYQSGEETPTYNVAEINHRLGEVRHEESGALYTPLKLGWKWSVQKEATRFFRAAGKMYRRGWQYENDQGETVKVPGSKLDETTGKPEPLDYLWVAENPDRIDEETGEYLGENPHIHLLMRWRVPYKHFDAWAARLEKLWGHGFAHLEKIKDPQKAGSYVAKAAGYLSKAQGKGDQGEIRGNRYGISTHARAPGWIECERHQVGMMGWLLAEAHELWNNKHGEKIQRREKLKRKLEAANDGATRQKIGRLLEGVRKEIEPVPRISKHAALFKTEEQKERFFDWASRKGWESKPQNSLWLEEWRRQQWQRRNRARLAPGAGDWAEWFALADAGAVECGNDASFQDVYLQELQA